MSLLVPAVVQDRFANLVGKPWFWLSLVLVIGGVSTGRAMLQRLPPPMPVLHSVGPFAFTDQHGQSFGSRELEGRVWVANFVFTRCPTICPALTKKMGEVQHRTRNLGDAFHLVSFSVDPEHDTPARLFEYARQYKASQRMWSFLTGDYEALRTLVVQQLKVHMDKPEQPDDLMGYAHGSHFVLVDQKGRVRGYYDSADARRLDELVRDAGLLANRGE